MIVLHQLLIVIFLTVVIGPQVPAHLVNTVRWLSDSARLMGIYLLAGKGSGKSRLMGRVIGWQDFVRGIPLVIIDPNGPTIHNLLDKLTRLPAQQQRHLWQRVRYVDMTGHFGCVCPWPLYYRRDSESLYHISQRYLEAIKRVDPSLQSAPVLGWNALWRLGTYVGMILAALGLQITEAESLLTETELWIGRFPQALHKYPEVAPAVAFFTGQYLSWSRAERENRSDAFRTKVAVLTLEPATRAMFGGATSGIDWAEVVEKRQVVLLDFSRETSIELRRFKMLWVFLSFVDFVKRRGAGRHQPISLIIDELTGLYNLEAKGSDIFSTDLDELINIIARNYSIYLTLGMQELFQIDEKSRKTLLSMGTHILGVTSDPEAALRLAQVYFPYDPHKVKRYEPIYGSYEGVSEVIDRRPVTYSSEEQQILNSYAFRSLSTFHFLVKTAQREGDTRGELRPLSIANLDRNQWVNEALVREAQSLLARHSSQPVDVLLEEIQERLSGVKYLTNDRMKGYGDPPYLSIREDDDIIADEK